MTDWTASNEVWYRLLLLIALIGCALLALLVIVNIVCGVVRHRKRKSMLRDAEKLLEESKALMDEDHERKPKIPGYDWAQYQADLHDRKVTFDEIWERSGGRFPPKPKDREPESGEKKPESPGAKSDDPDRAAELQEWFKKRGEEKGLKGLVAPPPNIYPVIMWRNRRR